MSLEAAWAQHAARCTPASERELRALRRAFYAGATDAFTELAFETDAELAARLAAMQGDLIGYAQQSRREGQP